MKKSRIVAFLFVFVCCLCVAGCSKDTLKLSEDNKTIKIGETFELSVNAEDVTWISTDAAVATVENGIVTGVKEGTAIINAICNEKTLSCNVKVENAYYPVLRIENKTATIFLGYDYNMNAVCTLGDDEVDTDLKWKSSEEKVATIDQTGKLTTVANGKTTISVSSTYDGIYVEDSVEVIVAGLNYIDAPAEIKMGLYAGDAAYTIDYTIYMDDAAVSDKAKIISKDTDVVSVTDTGELKAEREGKTVVTLQYDSDKDSISLDIPVTVERHVLHTFEAANECFYTGDVGLNNGVTIGEHWTCAKPTATTKAALDGRNGTGCYIWAYHWNPAISFPMELSKQELKNYLNLGYTKVVLPVYATDNYAQGIQIECAGYLSPELSADGWKEVEIPLKSFIENYDSYAVKATPILHFKNCKATDPNNVGGKEVGFNVYFGDIYLR